MRESPHAALIAVHVSEGDQSEALREFERSRQRLSAAVGLEPTARLSALLPRRGAGQATVTPAVDAWGMAIAPVGLLIIRAWMHEGSDRPLRVEVRLTGDVGHGVEREMTFSESAPVEALVTAWWSRCSPARGERACRRPPRWTWSPGRSRRSPRMETMRDVDLAPASPAGSASGATTVVATDHREPAMVAQPPRNGVPADRRDQPVCGTRPALHPC